MFGRKKNSLLWQNFFSFKIYLASVIASNLTYLKRTAEKAMAPHFSTLAWQIPWMEEPGRLQSMGSLGVGHDWETSLSLSCIGEGNCDPLQCSCLENPRDRVSQSRTWLRQLSSSSSSKENRKSSKSLLEIWEFLLRILEMLEQKYEEIGKNYRC